jgi:hypothetical protein
MCVCVCVCVCVYVCVYVCVCVCVFESRIFSLVDRSLISLVYLSLGYKVVQVNPFDFSLRGFFVQQAIRSTLLSPSSSRGLFFLAPRSGT